MHTSKYFNAWNILKVSYIIPHYINIASKYTIVFLHENITSNCLKELKANLRMGVTATLGNTEVFKVIVINSYCSCDPADRVSQ